MSSITSFHDAAGFLPTAKVSPQRPTLLGKVRIIAQAVRDGHIAARRYQELTARGVAHDRAAAQVFAEVYRAG